MSRFVRRHPPETVSAANHLFGIAEANKYGMAWTWWSLHGTWETVTPETTLYSDQSDLRGDQYVEGFRDQIRTGGPTAVFPTAPDGDEVDDELDPSQWPLCVRHDGKLWVLDGHHRLTAAQIEGEDATVLVADIDALRERVAASDPYPEPSGEELLYHVDEIHLFENDAFSGDVELVDCEEEADGVERVTEVQLQEWHAWAHNLGLSDHRH